MQKHVLKVLGLSLLAALGLMAFASAGAQAGEIKVLGAGVTIGQQFTTVQEGTAKFLVPGLNIEIRCTSLDVLEGKVIKSGEEGEALATVLHLGCKVFTSSSGTEISNCHLLDISGTENDITAKAVTRISLGTGGKAGKTAMIYSPDAGAAIAKIKFTTGLGCTLSSPVEIKGSVAFEFGTGNLQEGGKEVVEPLVESNEAIQKAYGAELKYGANPSYVDGSSKLKLATTNVGCTWGAL